MPSRFTDVDASSNGSKRSLARIEASDGAASRRAEPPALTLLYDESQRTAVVLQHFDTAEDMSAGAQAFSAMDASETPRQARTSVDMCEVKLERRLT